MATAPVGGLLTVGPVGILGGGQLGRMLALAATPLGITTIVLDPDDGCPAAQAATEVVKGAFTDLAAIRQLAMKCAVLTVEIEHVNASALAVLESEGVLVHPSSAAIALIQDKFNQKRHMRASGIPCSDFMQVDNIRDVYKCADVFGYPLMLKSRRLAYDGRGNSVIKSAEDVEGCFSELGAKGELYVERWVPYVRELAVLVAKTASEDKVYDAVETIQKDNICDTVWAPAPTASSSLALASDVALRAVRCIPSSGAGVFAVELFELADGSIVFNEIAPRVHNSGHYSIEACACSQFEQHIRCVTGLPLGSTAMKVEAAAMINIVGQGSDITEVRCISNRALEVPAASLHWYGKSQCRKGRKMGHITVVGGSMEQVRDKVARIRNVPVLASSVAPLVGIIMGSDSDLPIMSAAAHMLEKFRVAYELTIVSAHRTPERMFEYARGARDSGLRVIIAGAGGAAHLPGMVAAITTLPVIGVPVPLAHLDGVDSMHSILQMPKGIPVATVAIGNSTNAALLAIRILSAADHSLARQLEDYKASLKDEVLRKVETLDKLSWQAYVTDVLKPK